MPGDKPPRVYIDAIGAMDKGVNQGVAPETISRDQLNSGQNITVRGDFVNTRPAFRKIAINFSSLTNPSAIADIWRFSRCWILFTGYWKCLPDGVHFRSTVPVFHHGKQRFGDKHIRS